MVTRDLIVIAAIFLTIVLGIVLRVKKAVDIRWNIIYMAPMVLSVIHFLCSNHNIFMYPVYFAAFLEVFFFFFRKGRRLPVIFHF